MNVQKACEILEELVQNETNHDSNISTLEFLALNKVLLELNADGKYEIPKKYIVE